MSKRSFDIIASFVGLLISLPIFFICSVAIVINNGFPIFFRQIRVGKNGKDFKLLKFRTMAVRKDAEKGSFDAGSSARVTKIGKILRKTKLDELPQLWNVLKGDMSLVGPRPEVRKWVEVYSERWHFVHQVRPGITDPASIKFRNEEEILSKSDNPEKTYKDEILPLKLSLYEQYVQNRKFLGDIKLIFQTLWTVVSK